MIGLVGLAHATSHFFHLLLPPLFPVFIREFGLSYSELGLLVSVFFVISGVGQALSGFLVDRVGARPVLLAALGFFVAAALAAASAQGYGGLVLAAVLAGVGNAPFHPADFTILNRRVSPARLGHAFSAHGISGNLGWAVAPVLLIGVAELSGLWWSAYLAAELWSRAVLVVLAVRRDDIDDRAGSA
ncbi:MAG: MFS transporter, partial [Betaproteobacteria bacterium]